MASGDVLETTGGTVSFLLLDAVSGGSSNDGVWVDCRDLVSGVVVATGAATTTVCTVNASNGTVSAGAIQKPVNSVVGAVVTTGAGGAAVYSNFPALPKFLKATITTTGTGTVTAILTARKF